MYVVDWLSDEATTRIAFSKSMLFAWQTAKHKMVKKLRFPFPLPLRILRGQDRP